MADPSPAVPSARRKLGISSVPPNTQPFVPFTRVGNVHRHDPDIVALKVRCDLGVENKFFGLASHEKTRQVLVLRVCFDDLQGCGRVAKYFGSYPALQKAHGYVIRPANLSAGNTRFDELERRIRQLSPWQIRL